MKILTIKKIFGKFEYESQSNGSIKILGDWTKKHIVKSLINDWAVWHHTLITKQLHLVKDELRQYNLLDEFDLSNGGGCFVPRHKCWDPKRSLSLHSWGIAFDLNPIEYPYGSLKSPPSVLIKIFEECGFEWGGNWRTPDPMHLQVREIL